MVFISGVILCNLEISQRGTTVITNVYSIYKDEEGEQTKQDSWLNVRRRMGNCYVYQSVITGKMVVVGNCRT